MNFDSQWPATIKEFFAGIYRFESILHIRVSTRQSFSSYDPLKVGGYELQWDNS